MSFFHGCTRWALACSFALAGSMAWAGIFNSYYWVDPVKGVGGVFVSQLSPFGDPGALDCFGALERMAYA